MSKVSSSDGDKQAERLNIAFCDRARLPSIAFCDILVLKGLRMLIENRRAVDRFVAKHAGARVPFSEWVEKVEAARWTSLVELKRTFNSADYVRGLVVFNVGGNNFRAVAEVVYTDQVVRIAKVGTHAEYDRLIEG